MENEFRNDLRGVYMTVQELSQLYHIRTELDQLKAELTRLEGQYASVTGSDYNGMPKSPSKDRGKVESLASRVADLKDMITDKEFEEIDVHIKLEQWVQDVPDARLRVIFRERYINCGSWTKVAMVVGGGNTEDSVKKAAYRYLKRGDIN